MFCPFLRRVSDKSIILELKSEYSWLYHYIHYKVWDEITDPFSNINGCTITGASNFIPTVGKLENIIAAPAATVV